MNTAYFRFYEELNDFLSPDQRQRTLPHEFKGRPGVKDSIESFGVPHTEVELIIVGGESVDFHYKLQHGDRVAVYPVFESVDVSPVVRLRDRPLRRTAFVVDVNLGRLARYLRMCGFDVVYRNDFADGDVARISQRDHRIALTRDRRLLHRKTITHGYWVRATDPREQLTEVVDRFDLGTSVSPFKRCLDCNGGLRAVDKEEIRDRLEPLTRRYFDTFYQCRSCGKIYWPGSHYQGMLSRFGAVLRGRPP
jgi:uncharacterized protein with PIN domain